MTDLHDRIRAAVEARRERARATLSGPYDALSVSWPRTTGKTALLAFIAAEDPTTVLRHCDKDLDVLERHAPDGWNFCSSCCWQDGEHYFPHPYPCPEALSLARRYGIEAS